LNSKELEKSIKVKLQLFVTNKELNGDDGGNDKRRTTQETYI
jgi:hypothetical protein